MMPVKRIASRKAPGSDMVEQSITEKTIARRGTNEGVDNSNTLNAAQLEFIKQFIKNETNSKVEEEPKIITNLPQASRGWFTETVTATLNAMVHLILTLTVLVGHVLNKTNGFVIGQVIILAKSITRMVTATIFIITILALVLSEMVGLMVNTTRAVYLILETVLRKIFSTINELFDINMTVVKSDQTRNQVVDSNKVFRAAMTRKTLNMDLVQRQTVTKPNTLTVTQKEITSLCIDNTAVIDREEKLETSVRIFTDVPQSNVQAIEEQTGNNSNTRNVDLVSSPYVRPTVSSLVDKLAKWRRGRYFGQGTPTVTTEFSRRLQDIATDDRITTANRNTATERQNPSTDHYRPTQHHRHWQGPNVMPHHRSTPYSRTWNHGFNTYVTRTTVPPTLPRFGRFWNGYRYCDVSLFWPRTGQFRQDYRAFGVYPVPPMFHQWPHTTFGQNPFGQNYVYRPGYPGLYNNTYTV